MLSQFLVGAALALAAAATPVREQRPLLTGGLDGQQVDLIQEFVYIRF
jgi:hypothetical protein